ncbi:MAG: phosphodiesterase [Clostridia bacterium]
MTGKLMIASDLHGSGLYVNQLLEAFAREQAQRLLLLGDLLYHGPRNDLPDGYAPKQVTARLNEVAGQLLCVRGNCEAEVDQAVLDFPVLSDSALVFFGGKTLFLTHGHKLGPDNLPKLQPGDILLSGHTHVPMWAQRSGIWCLNPGSASLPKAGTQHGYMTLDEAGFCWKTLSGATYYELAI